MDHKCEKYM